MAAISPLMAFRETIYKSNWNLKETKVVSDSLPRPGSRLSILRARHAAIDVHVRTEGKRPISDTLRLQALKRQKLALKDQIKRLDFAS